MSEETYRDTWQVCQVLHGGEGPEHEPWVEWLSTRSRAKAICAAEEYAQRLFQSMALRGELADCDVLYIAARPVDGTGAATLYECVAKIDVRAVGHLLREQVELLPN